VLFEVVLFINSLYAAIQGSSELFISSVKFNLTGAPEPLSSLDVISSVVHIRPFAPA